MGNTSSRQNRQMVGEVGDPGNCGAISTCVFILVLIGVVSWVASTL